VVPDIRIEELLERTRRDIVEDRDRLDALALQIAELPAHIMTQMHARLDSPEAVSELAQVVGQRRHQRKDLIRCHP
jgi:hypothetical protein